MSTVENASQGSRWTTVVVFVPTAYVPIFLTYIGFVSMKLLPYPAGSVWAAFSTLHTLVAVLSLSLIIVFSVAATRNSALNRPQKIKWVLALWFFALIAVPLYHLRYSRSQRNREQHNSRAARPN